jgi:hypothetical protein
MIYPFVLSAGERLLDLTTDKKPLRLIEARTVGSGLAFLAFEAVRGG